MWLDCRRRALVQHEVLIGLEKFDLVEELGFVEFFANLVPDEDGDVLGG